MYLIVSWCGAFSHFYQVCFWLVENGLSVLIAACDTFRSGAVEQLRTHVRKLNALHPKDTHGREMVMLYERGYGKDSAGIAMEAIASGEFFPCLSLGLIDLLTYRMPVLRLQRFGSLASSSPSFSVVCAFSDLVHLVNRMASKWMEDEWEISVKNRW